MINLNRRWLSTMLRALPSGAMSSLDSPPGTPGAAPARSPLPRPLLLWLTGTGISLVGDATLWFALGWAASAHGGRTAALVLTAITVPRTLLLLLGGATADRFGARRMMITCDAVMLTAVLALAVTGPALGTPPWLLLLSAAVIGTVDAFLLPATGSMPRRLVAGEQLPRALALYQAGRQTAALLGGPLGAVLVATAGLRAAAVFDALTFAAVLAVLTRLRPVSPTERPDQDTRSAAAGSEPPGHAGRSGRRPGHAGSDSHSSAQGNLLADIADGVRLAATDGVLRPALLLTAAAAGGLLPVVSLLSPLLVRSNGWGPGTAGLIAAAQGAGILAVVLPAARVGPMRRAVVGVALGLGVAALGCAALTAAATAGLAVAAGVVTGAGSGLFACHVGPLVLATAPATHLSRVQSLLTLVQSITLVASNNILGSLADVAGPRTAIAGCAVFVFITGVTALCSAELRRLPDDG